MMVWADLHMHSAASDGQLSPTDLVRKAQAAGIELLALTDHDTLSGTEEAIRAGRTYIGKHSFLLLQYVTGSPAIQTHSPTSFQ